MSRILLASANAGKIAEFGALLAPLGLEIIGQDYEAPEETGLSFLENALAKARYGCERRGLPTLADDSGLCVPALNYGPGIHSARYSGAGDRGNNEKLLAEMTGQEDRRAFYVCVLVLMRRADDPLPLIAQGRWAGVIGREPRGSNGFGYDPLFFLPPLNKTAAELDSAEKNRLSHRGQALAQLISQLEVEKL